MDHGYTEAEIRASLDEIAANANAALNRSGDTHPDLLEAVVKLRREHVQATRPWRDRLAPLWRRAAGSLMTSAEASAVLGIDTHEVTAHCRTGTLRAIKPGDSWVIDRASVLKLREFIRTRNHDREAS